MKIRILFVVVPVLMLLGGCDCPEPEYVRFTEEEREWQIGDETGFAMRDQYGIEQEFVLNDSQTDGFHIAQERNWGNNCVTLYEEEYYKRFSTKLNHRFMWHLHTYGDMTRVSADLNDVSFSYDFKQRVLNYLSTPEKTLSKTQYADGSYDGDVILSELHFLEVYENDYGSYEQVLHFSLRDGRELWVDNVYIAAGVGLVGYTDFNGQQWQRLPDGWELQ